MDKIFPAPPKAAVLAVWGPWPTLGLALVIAASFAGLQLLVLVGYDLWLAGSAARPERLALGVDGLLLAIATLVAAPLATLLVVAFARLRRGASVRDYLGLHWPATSVVGRWLALAVLFVVAADGLNALFGRAPVPDFMRDSWLSAGSPALYVLALVVAAPVFEEVFFRGFLLRGLMAGRLGRHGAILLVALLWTLVHTQYDLFDLAIVFTGGVLLGWARVRTGSLILTILLHGGWNLLAVIQVAMVVPCAECAAIGI